MTNYNKLLNNLNELKLTAMAENLDSVISSVVNGHKDFTDSLYELTEYQISYKRKKETEWCIQWGAFPFRKTFEDFDFSFQPSINKKEVLEFKNLRFMEKAENILFVGSPGVGKTHLAVSIGLEAATHKNQVRFITCGDLLNQLSEAYSGGKLDSKLALYSRYKILIIDEIGYMPIDKMSANLLFQLINKRYEKRSTIITTNKALNKWGEMFNDNVMANAILDRLLHHSHIINITGRSYRLKDIVMESQDKSD